MDDTRPFPIQQEYRDYKKAASQIPWWLAEVAYKVYVREYGRAQTLERLAERGGFGRYELLDLLRKATKEDYGMQN